jgi:bla regulator protein BlaR1
MNTLDSLFEWVLAATLRASALAVVILGIQFVLGRRLPARWRHALWLPMVLVLVLPVLPTVPFGIMPKREKAVPVVAPTTNVGLVAETPVAATGGAVIDAVRRSVNPWASAWLTGTCVVLAVGLIGYRRNLKRIAERSVEPDAELAGAISSACRAAGMKRTPRVMVSPEVSSPAVTGLFRSVLLLPRDFPAGFTAAEARLILLHEFTHLKRRDLPVNWLLCVLQALHWFNPILWFAFARMRADREAACDADVLALDSGDHRSDYGHALLKLQASAPSSGLSLGFVGIFENASALRTRIQYIATHRRAHPAWRAAGVALIGVLTLVGATEAQERKPRRETNGAQNGKAKDSRQVALEKKLDAIVIPVVSLQDSSVEEAVDFLRLRSRELDKTTEDPPEKGVNFVIRNSTAFQPKTVTLALRDVTLRKAIENVAEAAGLTMVVGPFAVTLMPREDAEHFEKRAKLAETGAMKAAAEIIIPIVDMEDTSLKEGVDFLNKRAAEIAPDGKAPKIELGKLENEEAKVVEMRLRNVPLSQVLIYVAEATKAPLSADDEVIRFGK